MLHKVTRMMPAAVMLVVLLAICWLILIIQALRIAKLEAAIKDHRDEGWHRWASCNDSKLYEVPK